MNYQKQLISLKNIPAQSVNLILDGKDCTLAIRCWLGHSYAWFTANGIDIVGGQMCHSNVNFVPLRPKIFGGALVFINPTLDGSEPFYTGFNDKYRLFYIREG